MTTSTDWIPAANEWMQLAWLIWLSYRVNKMERRR